jgi:hypothetical protein
LVKAAFAYFASKLKEIGVKTVAMFKAIIHAVQSRECEARRKDLEAKKEAEAKAKDNGGKVEAPAAKPVRLTLFAPHSPAAPVFVFAPLPQV